MRGTVYLRGRATNLRVAALPAVAARTHLRSRWGVPSGLACLRGAEDDRVSSQTCSHFRYAALGRGGGAYPAPHAHGPSPTSRGPFGPGPHDQSPSQERGQASQMSCRSPARKQMLGLGPGPLASHCQTCP